MEADVKYFNSIEAGKILGVNVSTIKRWTDEGKLHCIRTAGGHRKFLMEHLADFLEKNKNKTEKVNLFPVENKTDLQISQHILKGDFNYLIDYVLKQSFTANIDRVQQVLNGLYLGQYQLDHIYDHLISPILHKIGDLWENKKLAVAEEHIVSQTILDGIIRLQGIIRLPRRKTKKALCLNFTHEFHSMALKMIQHILETRGFKVYNTGQNTPFIDLDKVFEKYHPNRVYVSGTIVEDVFKLQEEFDFLCELCERYEAELFVGGRAFDSLSIDHPAVVRRLMTFEDVQEF